MSETSLGMVIYRFERDKSKMAAQRSFMVMDEISLTRTTAAVVDGRIGFHGAGDGCMDQA